MSNLPTLDSIDSEKDRCWKSWAAKEVQKRALLGHYLLDGLISRMSGEVSVRHTANPLGFPNSEAAFEARTANEWLSTLRYQENAQTSFRSVIRSLFIPGDHDQVSRHTFSAFSLRVVLEGLQSLVLDCDSEEVPTIGVPTKSEIRGALSQVYDAIMNSSSLSNPERLETLLSKYSILRSKFFVSRCSKELRHSVTPKILLLLTPDSLSIMSRRSKLTPHS